MKTPDVLHHGAAALILAGFWLAPAPARAHCDSLEGPVVTDARLALEQGDPAPALKWVTGEHEAEVREVFAQVLAARARGDEARAVADRWFFETLVRLHRAGEGEPYTGLKPAGTVEVGIAAADQALRSGSVEELAGDLTTSISDEIQRRFDAVLERQKHAADSVEAGREYVAAYVAYIHYVESIDELAKAGTMPGLHEAETSRAH